MSLNYFTKLIRYKIKIKKFSTVKITKIKLIF